MTEGRTARIQIRTYPSLKDGWGLLAYAAGLTLTEWIETSLPDLKVTIVGSGSLEDGVQAVFADGGPERPGASGEGRVVGTPSSSDALKTPGGGEPDVQVVASDTSVSTPAAASARTDVASNEVTTSREGGAKPAPDSCPRAHSHRKGSYCRACHSIPKR